MPFIFIEAFNTKTSDWDSVGKIDLLNQQAKTWLIFGSTGTLNNETYNGIDPRFSNFTKYPLLRFTLDTPRDLPLNFSIRYPRFGPIHNIVNLRYGFPQEIDNFFLPTSQRTWGLVYLEDTFTPIAPVVPPVGVAGNYMPYERVIFTSFTGVLSVKMGKYIAGSLLVFINGLLQTKREENILDYTIIEENPNLGIFIYTGEWNPEYAMIIQYLF